MAFERTTRPSDSERDTEGLTDLSTVFEDRYRVRETPGGDLRIETRRPSVPVEGSIRGLDHGRFFLAEQRRDGNYGITLTEEGVKTFETALGIANDLGGNSLISPYSTIADIMERTATREELSDVLRSDLSGFPQLARVAVLRRKLRGSERPTGRQAMVGHVGKLLIVLLFLAWTLQQFVTAVQDIAAIPGLLGSIPSNLLDPGAPFGQIGSNISDAGHHFVFGFAGLILTYIVASLIRPLARIYRKDAIIPAERAVLRLTNSLLARLAPPSSGDPPERGIARS